MSRPTIMPGRSSQSSPDASRGGAAITCAVNTAASAGPGRPGVARLIAWGVLAMSMLVMPVGGATAALAEEADGSTAVVTRVSGNNRIATAVAVARTGWASADRVLLATSLDYPDAVAAAAYAAVLDAPLLLTRPDALSAAVGDLLADLGTRRVTILGGPRAVSTDVEIQLMSLGMQVDRVAGTSRFETAAELADQVARRGPIDVVAVALGDRADGRDAWPDALAAATFAALDQPIPTLLTRRTMLPEDTRLAIERLAPSRVLLLGGTGAITPEVEAAIAELGPEVVRLDGDNRYDTGVEVARRAMSGTRHGNLSADHAVLVSGEGFADALGAGALAARLDAPLLLVPGDALADEVDAFVRADMTSFSSASVIGGAGVIAEQVIEEIAAAIAGAPRPGDCPENSSPDCQYTYNHPIKVWEDLAQCESHQNWQANTGNGYYGGLQFHPNTWRAVGGTGLPHQHTKWEQIHRGEILQEAEGWGQWPACSRKLGYR